MSILGLLLLTLMAGCTTRPIQVNPTMHARQKIEHDIHAEEDQLQVYLSALSILKKTREKMDGERGARVLPPKIQARMSYARASRMQDEEYLLILKECNEGMRRRLDALHAELEVYNVWLLR